MSGTHQQEQPIEVFCSYAPADETLFNKLANHLSALERQGLISLWFDRRVAPGQNAANLRSQHLNSAQIILLCVSSDFLASDGPSSGDIQRAMQRHHAGEAEVIPVLLREYDWKSAPFGGLQPLPRDGKPIKDITNDEAFAAVARELRILVEPRRKNASPTSQPVSLLQDSVIRMPPSTSPRTIEQRETLVQDIYERLSQPDINAIVLTGIGGQGKSTLAALVYAHAEKQRKAGNGPFQAEAIWLSLDRRATTLDLATSLFEALGQPMPDFAHLNPSNQAIALYNALNTGDKSCLIVIDQFEYLLDEQSGQPHAGDLCGGDWIDLLNARPCSCRLLLTSRPIPRGSRDDSPDYIQPYPVVALQTAEGAALLHKRGVEPAQATDAELREAVTRCSGHALSLTLLASILRHDRGLSLKTLFSNTLYAHLWPEQIATNLLDYIYTRQLTDLQRSLLRAFSIYRQPVPLEAAAALLPTLIAPHLTAALSVLLAQHLIEPVATGTGLYSPHPIVATYALDHFAPDPTANQQAIQSAHQQAATYYQQVATQTCPPQEKRRKVSDVQPLVEAVWHLCQARQWQEAYDLMHEEYLHFGLNLWGGNSVLLELLRLLLPSDEWQPEKTTQGVIYNNIGKIYDDLGRQEEALSYYEQALAIRREVGDRWGEGVTLSNLGSVYNGLGRQEEALSYYEQALTIRREVGDRKGEGATLNNLGMLYDDLGRKEEALNYYEQALQLAREIGNREGEGTTLNNLGKVYDDLGRKEEALGYYKQALTMQREVGDRGGEGITLHNIGTSYFEQGTADVALVCFLLARGILDEVQSPGRAVTQSYMDAMQKELGEERFAALLAQVEPRAGEIVEGVLEAVRRGGV